MTDIKPCPACGAPANSGLLGDRCGCSMCGVWGPRDDRPGAKWNALPREPEWISVEDRLPASGEDVVVTDGTYVSPGWWSDTWGSWEDCPDLGASGPTHWQPLPPPPSPPRKPDNDFRHQLSEMD